MSVWLAIPLCVVIVGASTTLGYVWGKKDVIRALNTSDDVDIDIDNMISIDDE